MILVTEGQNQLRWGDNNKGTFDLKEAKGIFLGLDSSVPDKTWQHLWKNQGWMKIKIFMWLVHHKKILTWENIRKGGFMGPSRCQLLKSSRRIWSTFSTVALTPPGCGILSLPFSNRQIGIEVVSQIP